jgi:hypothetical protein
MNPLDRATLSEWAVYKESTILDIPLQTEEEPASETQCLTYYVDKAC